MWKRIIARENVDEAYYSYNLPTCCGEHVVRAGTREETLENSLADSAYAFTIQHGKLGGGGAAVLQDAISHADFGCLAKTTYPARFHVWPPPFAMLWDRAAASRPGVESAAAPDRRAKMADLQTRYPYGVAFLHVRDENDLAAHCAAVLQSEDFRIWGFDQEFVGSAGWIIERMLAAHPGPEARAAILKYRQWNARMPQRHSAPATLPSCSCLPCPPRSLRAPAPRIARMPARR